MNSSIASIFWTQCWQITLLIPVAILLVRYVIPRKPHLAYGILLLVLTKTIFPPIWDSPTGFVWELVPRYGNASLSANEDKPSVSSIKSSETSLSNAAQLVTKESIQRRELPGSSGSPVPNPAITFAEKFLDARSILIGIWLAGVLSLLGYLLGKRAQMLRFHRDTEVLPTDELLEIVENVSAELGLLKIPKVLVTLHPTVPFASGFFQQIVVLPAHVAEQTEPQELKLILAHEMTHLRRGDTLVGILQLAVQVLWWFHPLVYWLNREVRRVREECCDTDVVRRLNCQPLRYAHCLLNMLELHKKLRPSPELVGLSPLEVTKQRMQNIMRCSKHEAQGFSRIASVLILIVFALAILPASASSYSTPKVILGEISPPNAIAVPQPVPPIRKKKQPEKKLPEPVKKSEAAIDAPTSIPVDDLKRDKVPLDQLPEKLVYQWKLGDQLRYSVKIVAKYPTEIRTQIGEPTFRVDAYAAGIPALTRLTPKFESVTTPREGVELPSLPQLEVESDYSATFPFSSRIPFGPPGTRSSTTVLPQGSNSHIDPTSGSLPYLLGNLEEWVFPALPMNLNKSTHIEIERDVTLSSPQQIQLSPFDTVNEEKMQVEIDIKTGFSKASERELMLSRTWKLTSVDSVNGEPQREANLSGEIHLDRVSSFPTSALYSGRLVEREFNREYRIPLTLEIRRVD